MYNVVLFRSLSTLSEQFQNIENELAMKSETCTAISRELSTVRDTGENYKLRSKVLSSI